MSISKAVLMGKVVRDPEKRFTSSDVAVTTFSINVVTQRSEGPNLVRIITWRNLAETCADTIKKGQTIIAEGRLQINTYKDSSGADKKGIELDANNVEIVGSADKKADDINKEDSLEVPPPSESDYNISPEELINEEEIPF